MANRYITEFSGCFSVLALHIHRVRMNMTVTVTGNYKYILYTPLVCSFLFLCTFYIFSFQCDIQVKTVVNRRVPIASPRKSTKWTVLSRSKKTQKKIEVSVSTHCASLRLRCQKSLTFIFDAWSLLSTLCLYLSVLYNAEANTAKQHNQNIM